MAALIPSETSSIVASSLASRPALHINSSILLLFLCGICFWRGSAQVTGLGGPLPTGAETPHAVHGQVVNSVTGEPISRAMVQIAGQYITLTDHDGLFEFSAVNQSVPPFVMKPGYFYSQDGSSVTSAAGSTQSGSTQSTDRTFLIKLRPEAILSGTVTGPDGGPLEGISVQLKTLMVSEGLPRWTQRQQTRTNSEGQYRFAELEAGKYSVATGFHLEGLRDAKGAFAFVPAQYPEVAADTSAGETGEAIVLKTGDHREINLAPQMQRVFPVSGNVTGYSDEGGRFGGGIRFEIQTPGGEDLEAESRFNAHTGEFNMMLPSGSFEIKATAYEGRGTGGAEARRSLTVPQGPVSGVSLALSPTAAIPVDVEFETVNQPAQGEATPQPPPPNLALLNADPRVQAQQIFASGPRRGLSLPQSAGAGPRHFENVSPGRYLLQATPNQPWYVSAASCGSIDLMREELAIGGGAAGCSVRVVLRNDAGSVHISLKDPGPVGRGETAFVAYLLPVGDLVRLGRPMANPGPDFTVTGIAPGRYLVLALNHMEEFAYRDPETMRRLAGMGQEITVAPNGKTDVIVDLNQGEP